MKKFDEMILVKLHYFINWSIKRFKKDTWFWFTKAGLLLILFLLSESFYLVLSNTELSEVNLVRIILRCLMIIVIGVGLFLCSLVKDEEITDSHLTNVDQKKISFSVSLIRRFIIYMIAIEVVGDVCYVNNILDGMILKRFVPILEISGDIILLIFLYFIDIQLGISRNFLVYYSYNESTPQSSQKN